jgi:hypothetical protein
MNAASTTGEESDMSLVELPKWAKRQPRSRDQEIIGEPAEYLGPRGRLKLPEDLQRDLAAALDEPFGAPVRTAQYIADELAHLRNELTNARELVAKGEAKEAELQAELKVKIDEEIATKKATHDAEVAELEGLRPSTGETV